jgi:LemA protein
LPSGPSREHDDEAMSTAFLGAGLLVVTLLLLGYGFLLHNRLVRQRNMVEEAWSGVEVQLRRRADLVPNLVEAVRAYADHERRLIERLASERVEAAARHEPGAREQAERNLSRSLGQLLHTAAAFPELQSDDNFRKLQEQLATIEDELQMARRYYNGAARDLNTTIQSFPGNLIAAELGFASAPFFDAEAPDETPIPRVAFTGGG